MGGADCGDQHRKVGAGFSNVAHLKNGTRKLFWALQISVYFKHLLLGIYLWISCIKIEGEILTLKGETYQMAILFDSSREVDDVS